MSLLDPAPDEKMIDLSLVDVFPPKRLPRFPFCVDICITIMTLIINDGADVIHYCLLLLELRTFVIDETEKEKLL